jgi:WD40 repeat protein
MTLAVLPDSRLASGSADGTIRLWDPASGDQGSGQLIFVADVAITALAVIPGALLPGALLPGGQSPGASLLVAGDTSGRLHWLRLLGSSSSS